MTDKFEKLAREACFSTHETGSVPVRPNECANCDNIADALRRIDAEAREEALRGIAVIEPEPGVDRGLFVVRWNGRQSVGTYQDCSILLTQWVTAAIRATIPKQERK